MVAHDEELHPIQIEAGHMNLGFSLTPAMNDQKRRTSGHKNAKSSATQLGERWLRHREISRQVHTDTLVAATQVNKYMKGGFVKRTV